MNRLSALILFAVIAFIGTADATPYGYNSFRPITIDHTRVNQTSNGYSAYRSVTIHHSYVSTVGSTSLTNFPVLISGTYSFLATVSNSGFINNTVAFNGQTVPADLIFTSDSGCLNTLNWEIASYSAASGTIEAWVTIPGLSASTDTVIYMCYGNSSINAYQGGSVGAAWNSNYSGVWHFANGATLSANDSTANGNNLTNTSGTATTGDIDGGVSLNGTSAGFNDTSPTGMPTGTLTYEAWVNVTSDSVQNPIISTGNGGLGMRLLSPGVVDFTRECYSGVPTDSTTAVSNSTWTHVAVTFNYSTNAYIFYVNGVAAGSGSYSPGGYRLSPLYIGKNPECDNQYFGGILDEVRISNTVLTPDWIVTEFNNVANYTNFLTIGSQTTGGSDQTNFPVLISGTYSYLATSANGGLIQKTTTLNGQTVPLDLIFTADAAGQTTLNWEVASYTPATGAIEIWVRIPTLSHTADTTIYMWYNNPNAVSGYLGNATGAWDSNFQLVYHMNETSGTTLNDSTANGNAGTKKGTSNPAPTTTGKISGGQVFVGNLSSTNNDYVTFSSLTAATTTWTAEWWAYVTAAHKLDAVFLEGDSGTFIFAGYLYASPTTSLSWRNTGTGSISSLTAASLNAWHHVVFVRNTTTITMYLDGAAVTSAASNQGSITDSFKALGWDAGSNRSYDSFTGTLDEVRFSATARSGDWIATEYNNQNAPDKATYGTTGFYTVGAQGQGSYHVRGFAE